MMKLQSSYTSLERAYARSIVKNEGIRKALRTKIVLRVKARGTASKVKITSKLKSTNQERKNRIQENSIANLEKLRKNEIIFLTDEFFELSSRNKKKFKNLQDFISSKAVY